MKQFTLLAVDDTPANLYVLGKLVAEHLPECRLVSARNAEEGLALVAEHSFDGALLDVQMPGVDGIEMCRRLKQSEKSKQIPIILMTAHGSTSEFRAGGLHAGADDFISRPVDNIELVAKIRVMLRIRRAEKELREINSRLETIVAERTQDLQESRRQYRLLVENQTDMIVKFDTRGRLLFVSPSYCQTFGKSPDELLGTLFQPLLGESGHNEVAGTIEEVSHPPHAQYVQRRSSTAEGWRWHAWTNTAVLDEHGKVVAVVAAGRDVTKRKLAEEELARAKVAAEAANRAKTNFLANMSHEIRTPITSIMGFTQLLLSDDPPADQRRQHLQKVYKSTENLLAIINDILDLTKIEAEKIDVDLSDYSPVEAVEEVCSLLKVRADCKNLKLNFNCHFPLPETIRTDRTRLRQILVNLVANAIKFTETGSVNIALQLTDGRDGNPRMQFHVTDTGIGMSEEQVENLFEPFTQADNSSTRRFGGTGLGLAISARLAALMGGRIDVKSSLGKGSTFILGVDPGPLENVSLLESAAKLSEKTEKAPGKTPTRTIHGNVLLAEDDEDMQELVCRFLRASGINVDVATNGRAAYEKAIQSETTGKPYDLILMDIRMPEMDGYETTRRLRREGWQRPIVAQTAHALTGDREKCLEAGCDDYVVKPVSTDALLDTVARYLKEESPGYPKGTRDTFANRAL